MMQFGKYTTIIHIWEYVALGTSGHWTYDQVSGVQSPLLFMCRNVGYTTGVNCMVC